MSSSAGPSRGSRPRRSSASTSNGSTASSTGTADGARIGLLTEIFVSEDCETMALIWGRNTRNERGFRGEQKSLPRRVKAPGQNALLRVQAIFGLVEHHRLRAVDHLVGD